MEGISEKVFDFLTKIPKTYYLPIILAAGGIVFFSIGLMQLSNSHKDQFIQSSQEQVATQDAVFGTIQVDVEGAVMHPGVYKLALNARIQDALVAAGGMSADASREIVAKSLNLAAKVVDGAKVYVPKVSDVQNSGSTNSNTAYLGAQVHLIDLNSCSSGDLEALPGVGTVTAGKIIAGRPYQAINDLKDRKIVSSSVFEKIKEMVSVY